MERPFVLIPKLKTGYLQDENDLASRLIHAGLGCSTENTFVMKILLTMEYLLCAHVNHLTDIHQEKI